MIDINQIESFEEDLKQNKINQETGLLEIVGSKKILITTPHSVIQKREDNIKYAETRTASIAKIVSSSTNCFALIKTAYRQDDANYDKRNYFKDKTFEIINQHEIKLLIDLHIMSNHRGYNIDIGTGEGKNINTKSSTIDILKKSLSNNLEHVYIDKFFKSLYSHTMSSTMSREAGIDCVQIELNFEIIEKKKDLEYIINALISAINNIIL